MWKSPGQSGQDRSRPLMFIHELWKIDGNDGRFLTGVESDLHNAGGRHLAVSGQPEGADMHRPSHVFYVRNPAAAYRLGRVSGKAGLWKCV